MKAEDIVNRLLSLYRENKLAHAYLFETNNITNCFEDIKKVVKGISCEHGNIDHCDKCNICHLIDENLLPSFIIIEPDGKNIKKEAIDNLKHQFSTKPIYTLNNIYIIKYPEKMNDTAFNKLLKFLEEPEENIIGFFITENKDNVANTIISRCEIVKITYNISLMNQNLNIDEEAYNIFLQEANDYEKLLSNCSSDIIWYNNSVLTGKLQTREDITKFLRILLNLYIEKYKTRHLNSDKKCANIVTKYLEQLNYNVNTMLLLNSLALEIGEVYGK